MPEIRVVERFEFGNRRLFLRDDKEGRAVQKLTGNKTLSAAHISALVDLGYVVVVGRQMPYEPKSGLL